MPCVEQNAIYIMYLVTVIITVILYFCPPIDKQDTVLELLIYFYLFCSLVI